MKPIVFVDTTETHGDPYLNGTAWIQLQSLSARGDISLAIPEVVVRETARHGVRDAEKALEAIGGAMRRFPDRLKALDLLKIEHNILSPTGALPEPPSRAWVADCIRENLELVGAEILPIPTSPSHEELVERDLDLKKPFLESGKGYRDALIWESIRIRLKKEASAKAYFVSHNSSDFSDAMGGLHEDLRTDLADVDICVIRSLGDLLSLDEFAGFVSALARTPEELSAFLGLLRASSDKTIGEVIHEAVVSAAEDLVGESVFDEDDALDFGFPHGVQMAGIETVTVVDSSFDWHTYEIYDETTLLIQAEISVELTVYGYIFKSDHDITDMPGVSLYKWDWNDHMAEVGVEIAAKLIFQIRAEEGAGTVDDVTFESIEPADL